MDVSKILARLDLERRDLGRDGETLEQLPFLTRIASADGKQHSVIHSSLSAETADAAIAGQIEHYRSIGREFEWKAYAHDGPPDLLDRLRRREFEIGPKEAVLVYDLADAQPWLAQADASPVIRIERVDQVADYKKVAEEVFHKQYDFTAGELIAAINSGSTQHRGYIAYAGQKPVSIGRLYTHPESYFGGLYGGATLPEFRNRGHYRAIIAARARDAIALGAKYLIVDALPTSKPVLERMGFEEVSATWPCVWTPPRVADETMEGMRQLEQMMNERKTPEQFFKLTTTLRGKPGINSEQESHPRTSRS